MKKWSVKEAGLLDEMKSRCLNKGQYIDDKAKDKFYMLCHLEDYSIEYYNQQEEITRLNTIFDELEEYLKFTLKVETSGEDFFQGYDCCLRDVLDKLKELKEGK